MRVFTAIICAIRLVVQTIRSIRGKVGPEPMTLEELDAALAVAALSVPDATDWRHSIVDLLKILQLDWSYEARAELWRDFSGEGMAGKGPYAGSEVQNVALHKAVMRKVREHEIKV